MWKLLKKTKRQTKVRERKMHSETTQWNWIFKDLQLRERAHITDKELVNIKSRRQNENKRKINFFSPLSALGLGFLRVVLIVALALCSTAHNGKNRNNYLRGNSLVPWRRPSQSIHAHWYKIATKDIKSDSEFGGWVTRSVALLGPISKRCLAFSVSQL